MVFSFNQQDISFNSEIPPDLIRYQVPGSKVYAANTDSQKVLIQELDAGTSSVYYTVHVMDKKSDFIIKDKGPFFMTYLALKHDRNLELEGLGRVLIKEGQYNIIYSPKLNIVGLDDPGREYITLAVQYDLDFLRDWSQYFPDLASFLQQVEQQRPAIMLSQPGWLTKEIQDTVFRLIHANLQTQNREVYFDLQVKTLLFHLLNQSVQQEPPSKYSHYEVEGIQAAGEMIRKNIRYHFVIREIAQKVGMNEFKLKNGFRELFGNGVYEYLRTERMQAACHFLSERSRSIKEVAALTGYHSVNSFIKAFKKKYGRTPGEYRKSA